MSENAAKIETPAAASAPRPRLVVTPAKPGYPEEGGSLDLLLEVGVELPSEVVDRRPLALALVLDRSGSMTGAPLEATRAAASAAIEMLLPDDRVAVVTFDDQVRTLVPMTRAGADRRRLLDAVRSIEPGGSTNLFGGWAEGLSQAMSVPATEASARVVLLSDGQANVGVTDAPTIAGDVSQASEHGVTTTSMGFGRLYDEALLRTMADAGSGNYVFIEGEAQVTEAFQHELSGLSALRGRHVRLEPSSGLTLETITGQLPRHGAGLRLPDLVGGLERELVAKAIFAPGATAPTLTLTWSDLLTGREQSLRLPLEIEPLSREAFEALPTDPVVATQLKLARLAELKLKLSNAFRVGDVKGANALLDRAAAAVAALPEGEERAAEESELGRLRQLAKSQELRFAARYSEKFARDRAFGISDHKRVLQFQHERDLYAKKLAAAPPTFPATELHGPNGPVTVRVVIGDITDQVVDVLVNSTNRHLFGNAGVDGAVHRRGGPELTLAARQLGPLDFGQAVFTPGFRLPAKYVVHTVAAPWQGGGAGERAILERAYHAAFGAASQLGARTLAVAALGTGTYQVPTIFASDVAFAALRDAVAAGATFTEVRFVILDPFVASDFASALPRYAPRPAERATSGQPN